MLIQKSSIYLTFNKNLKNYSRIIIINKISIIRIYALVTIIKRNYINNLIFIPLKEYIQTPDHPRLYFRRLLFFQPASSTSVSL